MTTEGKKLITTKELASLGEDADTSNLAVIKESVPGFELGAKVSEGEFELLFEADEIKGVDPKGLERAVTFTISDESRDRDRDVIKQSGWDLKAFRNNPVALWAHNHKELPIGRLVKIWKDHGPNGPRLRAIKQFTPEEIDKSMGYTVFRMIQEGFLKAASVGFRPIKFEPDTDDEMGRGMRLLKNELLESSVVPVGSNANAFVEAKSSGIDMTPVIEWCVKTLDTCAGPGIWVPQTQILKLHEEIKTKSTFVVPESKPIETTPEVKPEPEEDDGFVLELIDA